MRHTKMKELPHEERPYERCVKSGPEYLSDAQLLAVILRTGSTQESVLELAGRILELGGPGEGILGLLHLSLPELMSVKGIGQVKAIQLQCIGELSRRIWKRKAIRSPVRFNEPAQVAEYYQEDLRHKEQEEFHMMLDRGCDAHQRNGERVSCHTEGNLYPGTEISGSKSDPGAQSSQRRPTAKQGGYPPYQAGGGSRQDDRYPGAGSYYHR